MPRRPARPRGLFVRAGVWYGWIKQTDGTKSRVSSGIPYSDSAESRAAAVAWRDAQHASTQRLAAGGLSAEAALHTVAEALDWWLQNRIADHKEKTREMYTYAARCIRDVLGRVPVNALTREQISDYLRTRVEGVEDPEHEGERIGTHARSTVLKERITLRAALKAAAERGLFVRSLEAVVPPFKFKYVPRRVFLRVEDLPKLLGELEAHRAFWVRVVVFSGCGHAEVEALDWGDDQGPVLRVPGTKTDTRDRLVPIGAELRAVLAEVPAESRVGPIVQPWENVNRDLGRACARAGIVPRVTAHDLRRTFGSWLAQADVSTKKIGALLGHAPGSKMADLTYSVLTDEGLRDAVERLPTLANVKALPKNRARGKAPK